MLVSDLIKFRDDLTSKLEMLEVQQAVEKSAAELSLLLKRHQVASNVAQGKVHSALATFEDINVRAKDSIASLKSAINDINQDIDRLASELLIKPDNYPIPRYFKPQSSLYRSDKITKTVYTRLRKYSDFRFPGMQLMCNAPQITSEMVASDPLYLCDHDITNINNTTIQFNEVYNRRVMKYVIPSQAPLALLPHNQFGFILSWMYFNFFELSTLEEYLKSIILLLRPGGVFMFSYNNGDLTDSCLLTEQGGMSFIPKRKLIEVCENLGYEILDSFDLPNRDKDVKYISWIEIKKPGTLTTTKRSQSLGTILQK